MGRTAVVRGEQKRTGEIFWGLEETATAGLKATEAAMMRAVALADLPRGSVRLRIARGGVSDEGFYCI